MKKKINSQWHYMVHKLKHIGKLSKIKLITEDYNYISVDHRLLYYTVTPDGIILVSMHMDNNYLRSAVYELTLSQFVEFKNIFMNGIK
jgi:hypothetical protein